jgi:hypothetical protein
MPVAIQINLWNIGRMQGEVIDKQIHNGIQERARKLDGQALPRRISGSYPGFEEIRVFDACIATILLFRMCAQGETVLANGWPF